VRRVRARQEGEKVRVRREREGGGMGYRIASVELVPHVVRYVFGVLCGEKGVRPGENERDVKGEANVMGQDRWLDGD